MANNSLLVSAVSGWDTDVRMALKLGADPNAQFNGIPVMVYANARTVNLLLDFGWDPLLDAHDDILMKLLDRNADSEVLYRVIVAGAHVDGRNIRRQTPLMFAKSKILTLLIEFGADVDAQDDSGMTPLMHACRSNRITEAEYLVEAGADVGMCTAKGETALFMTSDPEMIDLLCFHGASAYAQNKNGETPLSRARTHFKNRDLAMFLKNM